MDKSSDRGKASTRHREGVGLVQDNRRFNPGGPTTKPDNFQELVQIYLDECELLGQLPSIEGLAIRHGMLRSTIYAWSKKDKHILDTLEYIQQLQKQELLNKGLNNLWNSNIVKLALGNHGFSDKVDNKQEPMDIQVRFVSPSRVD